MWAAALALSIAAALWRGAVPGLPSTAAAESAGDAQLGVLLRER